jgi:hypothetical protein
VTGCCGHRHFLSRGSEAIATHDKAGWAMKKGTRRNCPPPFVQDGISTSLAGGVILRISSVIFIEQYLGPHMLQK